MKHALIIIGEDLRINSPFLAYIFRLYEDKFQERAVVHYIDDNDINLPFKIEHYSNEFDFISIVSNESNFGVITKILSTLTSDSLELKENTITPSRAVKFSQDSFVCELNLAQINLLKAATTKELPQFLCEFNPQSTFFQIIDTEIHVASEILEPLKQTYNVDIKLSKMTPNLILARVTGKKFAQTGALMENVRNSLPRKIVAGNDIVGFVAQKLIENNKSVAFGESCTAGMCASLLGGVAGVSAVFEGSVVSYSNYVKQTWLDVSEQVLAEFGAVSAQCVEQMCKGISELCKSDFSVAISGIAGPGGGSDEKPVGTVFVGVFYDGAAQVKKFNLSGDRNYVRKQSALCAYAMIAEHFC